MDTNVNGAKYREVPLDEIIVPEGRRQVNEAKVAVLAESITEIGLLQPVGLTSDYHLVYGAHRLAAYRRLGRQNIPS